MTIPGLLDTHEIFVKWITKSDHPAQLTIYNNIVPEYFNLKRFPTETANAISLAKISLLLEVDKRIEELKSILV